MHDSLDDRHLRVGIVTHYWLPHMGGIEVLARDQAHALADRGWEVTVFTSRLRGDPAESQEGAVRVRRFRCTNILETRLGVPVPLMAPSMFRALVQATRDLDVIVAHGHVYIGSMYATVASRLAAIPLVVVQHNPFVDYSNPLLNTLERVADRTLGKAVFHRAAQIIAVSDFTKAFVESIVPQCPVTRIYPGVDLDSFRPPEVRVQKHRPLFLTVRRLVPRNGIEVLVRAWLSGDIGEHADLAIVGEGPLREDLDRVAGPNPSIRFLGRLPDDDLRRLYHAADVFVLPTVSGEGYGLALAEALASELPVIATDDGGARELVVDGVTGLTVPASDAGALARAMRMLALEPHLRADFSSNSRRRRTTLDRRLSNIRFERCIRTIFNLTLDSLPSVAPDCLLTLDAGVVTPTSFMQSEATCAFESGPEA